MENIMEGVVVLVMGIAVLGFSAILSVVGTRTLNSLIENSKRWRISVQFSLGLLVGVVEVAGIFAFLWLLGLLI